MFRKLFTFIGNLIFFGVPFVLLLVGVLVWNTAFLFESIKPENASPFRILLWICVRDMEKQPPEIVTRLLDRVEETVGRSSGELPDLEKMDLVTRTITAGELKRRREMIAGYTLFAAASGRPEAVKKNEEILAGKPLAERNILYLFKFWYIREMDRYDAASTTPAKQAVMQKFVDDLKWWRPFSENLYLACEVPPLSFEEMVKEYEMTFEHYRQNTDPETYRRMLAFRDKLQSAFVVSETKNHINRFFGPLFGQ